MGEAVRNGEGAGAEAPRSCSTSVSALISTWRRSISSCRSAIACAMTLQGDLGRPSRDDALRSRRQATQDLPQPVRGPRRPEVHAWRALPIRADYTPLSALGESDTTRSAGDRTRRGPQRPPAALEASSAGREPPAPACSSRSRTHNRDGLGGAARPPVVSCTACATGGSHQWSQRRVAG